MGRSSCGFCREILNTLNPLEADAHRGAPKLLVISAQAAEDNAGFGSASEVVFDPDFRTGREPGIHGTPTAILIGVDGGVASSLALGTEAILKLAGTLHPGPGNSLRGLMVANFD